MDPCNHPPGIPYLQDEIIDGTDRAALDPRKAVATVADVESAYRRGAQHGAALLLAGLTGDRRGDAARYLIRLAVWREQSLSRRDALPRPTAKEAAELQKMLSSAWAEPPAA